MMFRPILLLCGAIVIAVAPVWADKISYTDVVKESSDDIESPVKAAHHPDLNLNASLVSGSPAEPAQSPAVLIGTFETDDVFPEEQLVPAKVTRGSGLQMNSLNAESLPGLTPQLTLNRIVHANDFFDFGGWAFYESKGKFFRSLPDTASHAASVSQGDSNDLASPVSHLAETGRTDGHRDKPNVGGKNPNKNTLAPGVGVVPEPGSLSLLLLGLAGVGFLGRRRENC